METVTHEKKLEKKGSFTALYAAVICVVLIAGIAFGYFVGTKLYPSTNAAENKIADMSNLTSKLENYLTANFLSSYNATAKIKNYTDMGDIYMINVSIMQNNSELDKGTVFVTKDGEFMVNVMYNLSAPFPKPTVTTQTQEEQPEQANVSKSEKPSVTLYIFSYCPAGTAALDAYGEVGKLLANQTDMKVKFFSDMHGQHELQQNKIQECIQQVDAAKYWNYVNEYVAKVYNVCGSGRDINCDKNESIKLMTSVGINSDDVMKCVTDIGASLYSADIADATRLQLSYSPSIVVNGVSLGADFDRTPEGTKNLICSAFVNPPAECSQTLGESVAPSGSCG